MCVFDSNGESIGLNFSGTIPPSDIISLAFMPISRWPGRLNFTETNSLRGKLESKDTFNAYFALLAVLI